jgi:predicted outer membrane repeat protein
MKSLKIKGSVVNLIIAAALLFSHLPWGPATAARERASQTTASTIRYVKQGGTGNCDSWGAACELRVALPAAQAGDQIWVAEGVYKPTTGTDRTATFQIKSEVAIYGGFPPTGAPGWGDRDWEDYPTVLSGDIGTEGNTDDNVYHVVTGSGTDGTAVLDGFTITGGNANSSTWPHWNGGGMLNVSGSPTLTNVTFQNNSAISGGGISTNDQSSPILTNVTFHGNSAAQNGGGMFNRTFSNPILMNVIFSVNTAGGNGGGMSNTLSNPILTNVTFIANTSLHNGGGMHNFLYSSPTLTNVNFQTNSSGDQGGGMANIDNSSPTLTNVNFQANSSEEQGGGMFNQTSNPILTEVNFSNNAAGISGGGISNISSNPELVSPSFTGNSASQNGGGIFNSSSSPNLRDATFWQNEADNGGGMYNIQSSPQVTQAVFIANSAVQNGGGMLNENNSSPTLINATFSGNIATKGGAIANLTTSIPKLKNTILWGNNATQDPEIYDEENSHADGLYCMVKGTYHNCYVIPDSESPFVNASGGDLRLVYTSNAIDAGDNSLVLPGLTTDLDGNPRFFADKNLDEQPDPDARVDLGAYEAQHYPWYMNYAGIKLEEGKNYRQGYHALIDDPKTVAQTLQEYAYNQSEQKLKTAIKVYEFAMEWAATDAEHQQALLGVQDAVWELATGAMLLGNDKMVKALAVHTARPDRSELVELQDAADQFGKAVSWYLELITSDQFPYFLASQPGRIDPLTGDVLPYADLIRLAYSAAKKNRAVLELGERQFRYGQEEAEQTLQKGYYEAQVELVILQDLWPEVVDDPSYLELLRSMGDMQRIYGFIQAEKNPFGYGSEFVPFHYRPTMDPSRGSNNYEHTKWLADDYLNKAIARIVDAAGYQQQIDDDYTKLQTALNNARTRYDQELQSLCGDLKKADCGSGEVYKQIISIKEALLRIDMVLQQMDNQNALIRIEQDRAAKVAGIHKATAELITEDGEKLADLAKQEVEVKEKKGTAGGIAGILTNALAGGIGGGSAGGPWGAVAGAVAGGAVAGLDWYAQDSMANDLTSVVAQKERLYAKQKARVHYAEAQVVLADSEAKQRQYFLKFAELNIDYAIALNHLMQELAQLHNLQTRAQYLITEKEKAFTFHTLLDYKYLDPAARMLSSDKMETAHSFYETALDQGYRAGRALEYEINQEARFTSGPLSTLDDLYPLYDSNKLDTALDQMDIAYENWHAQNPSPQTRTAIIYLSQALGLEDYYDPQLNRIVTREEQFNALVRGRDDPKNLSLSFLTSLHLGNSFFPTLTYNDKIISIKARVRGSSLGIGGREPAFVDIQLTQGGTSFIRSSASGIACRQGEDLIHEYNIEPLAAVIQAALYQKPFPQTNKELATRSVAFTNWVLQINTALGGENQYLNLNNIDEIELFVEHEAYTLQCVGEPSPSLQSSLSYEPPPTRSYQPIVEVLAAWSFTESQVPEAQTANSQAVGGVDLNDTYIGSVMMEEPYLPNIPLVIALQGSGTSISGHIQPTLNYPLVAISGQWSGTSFSMSSAPFEVTLDSGLTYTRQLFFESGEIKASPTGDNGITLTGVYRERLTGLTPEVIEMTGEFYLNRPEHALEAAFTADSFVTTPGSLVRFEDLSIGKPVSWEWSFGDGTKSNEQHPTHRYNNAGSYTVTLKVTSAFETSTVVKQNYITISQPKIYLPMIQR